MHDLLVLVSIAIDQYASAGVHAICVDTQVELDNVLYRLGRYRLICGNHFDGRASTSVHLILDLLPTIYGDLTGERRRFGVCVGQFLIPPNVVVLLLNISLSLLLTARILEILKRSADLHRIMRDIVAVDLAAADPILSLEPIAVIL